MKNDPTLFISSVSDKKEGIENQENYDSRNNFKKRNLVMHRIDDIKAMSFFNMSIYVKVFTKEEVFEGYISNIDDENIYIQKKELYKKIKINDVKDILIKKV